MSYLSLEVKFPSSAMTVHHMFTGALNLANAVAASATGKDHQVEMGFVYQYGNGQQVHVFVEPGAKSHSFHDAMREYLTHAGRSAKSATLRVTAEGACFTQAKQLAPA